MVSVSMLIVSTQPPHGCRHGHKCESDPCCLLCAVGAAHGPRGGGGQRRRGLNSGKKQMSLGVPSDFGSKSGPTEADERKCAGRAIRLKLPLRCVLIPPEHWKCELIQLRFAPCCTAPELRRAVEAGPFFGPSVHSGPRGRRSPLPPLSPPLPTPPSPARQLCDPM